MIIQTCVGWHYVWLVALLTPFASDIKTKRRAEGWQLSSFRRRRRRQASDHRVESRNRRPVNKWPPSAASTSASATLRPAEGTEILVRCSLVARQLATKTENLECQLPHRSRCRRTRVELARTKLHLGKIVALFFFSLSLSCDFTGQKLDEFRLGANQAAQQL